MFMLCSHMVFKAVCTTGLQQLWVVGVVYSLDFTNIVP